MYIKIKTHKLSKQVFLPREFIVYEMNKDSSEKLEYITPGFMFGSKIEFQNLVVEINQLYYYRKCF